MMQLVEHRMYGRGKLQRKRFSGFELYVKFQDGISRWIRHDEARFLSGAPLLTKHETPKPVLSEKQFKARQKIEALRLGIVPHGYVEEFTFGRDEEIKQIKSWLSNSMDGSLIISGEYGVGKTHFLEYIYTSAFKNNWAVSIVELDPNELPFHKPKAIYENIIRSFKFKNQNCDFREFLRKIANSPNFYKLEEHKYLGKIIEKIRNGTDDEYIWEWIEGKTTWYHYPQMYQYSTCANIYCYMLSGIGWAAKNILGLNGFLILFDEAESVDSFWYTSYQNNKSWNFLRGLIMMSNNDELLLDEVRQNKFYEHYTYGGWWGDYSDLQYCGYLQLPFIWKIPCYVKIIFAFTPVYWILESEPLKKVEKFELEHLNTEYLVKISEKITTIYKQAYNFQRNTNIFGAISGDSTRRFIKELVEALDLMRFHPDKQIKELLK